MIRREVLRKFIGFKTQHSEIVDMDIDFLFNLAREEAPFRSDEEFDFSSKEILFDDSMIDKSKQLSNLFNNWNENLCEPIDLKKEGSFYMINDGFHRIIVAKKLGLKTLKVKLQEGEFILDRSISFYDLPKLLDMLKIMFPKMSIDDIIKFLLNPELDKRKMKSITIGLRNLNEEES